MNEHDGAIQGEISQFLSVITAELSHYLEEVLPSLYEDWWGRAVVSVLSFQQKRRLEQSNVKSLSGLDLAALIRVLDSNWYQISSHLNLSSESRHYIKEMQTVRNRWAHSNTDGFVFDDVYRDLDTMQRFVAVIGGEQSLIERIRKTKSDYSLMENGSGMEVMPSSEKIVSEEKNEEAVPADLSEANSEDNSEESKFHPGQLVFLKSNPSNCGAVMSVIPGKPENRYVLFIDNLSETFYESQLQEIKKTEKSRDVLNCDLFHARLTALQIKYPSLSTLYSLNAARVDFIPYQFRPVLRFIRSDRPRMLIADGVGVGKTIEAGLILRELQARRDIRSVLIICPRPLVTEKKWQREMKRFDENFIHLDGPALRYCIEEMDLEGLWPEQYQKIIVPYSLLDETLMKGSDSGKNRKKRVGLEHLTPPPRFDLVIVDEAHHIRSTNTFSHKAVKFFCDNAEAAIFLTATPIQLGNKDLFVLLNTLRPDLIIDKETFSHQAEPNPHINQAVFAMRSQEKGWQDLALEALDKAAATSWGNSILRHNPVFQQVHSELQSNEITQPQRVRMISLTEEMHTFARIINRTRRRDIGNFTIRKPETIKIPFTPAQELIHDELLKIQADIFKRLHGRENIKFMMTTIRRQAASCLFGLAPFLEDILKRHLDELAWEEADENGIPDEEAITVIQSQIEDLIDLIDSLEPEDPKLEALRKIINDKQTLPNNKVMLFSSFRHTLNYLFQDLSKAGYRVGLVHGGTPDEERMILRSRFQKPREDKECLDLLLFSEIGCEGLDYQFCDCIVNYDLPWNPMRVEQRIGRIDRNGQKSDSVAIVNLITPGTVDADIYDRCLMRIGVFNNAIGGSEEILGEVTREIISIAENFDLTTDQRNHKLQQIADNKIRLIQEQETLEQKQAELFGINLPQEQLNREISDASSYWLTSDSLRRMIIFYLQKICGKEQEFILGDKPLKTLRLSQEARDSLFEDFRKLHRQNTTAFREWEKWLKGGNQHLSITFDSDCAIQNPEAAFIMPLHPLIKQAAMSFDTKQRVITNLKVKSDKIPPGQYEFAIYQWRLFGIQDDLLLKPVASDSMLTDCLVELLKKAEDNLEALPDLSESVWVALEDSHYDQWNQARILHQRETMAKAEFRRESLSTSHRGGIALLEEKLSQAVNQKIQKMRRSQLENAEADYSRHIQELDMAVERADIVAGVVAYGVMLIEAGEKNVK
ncbi:MAG: helicase [Candidatus Wallbacteria bacterium HGW-Wallbacteria-1]|jgi:superfamily II DNA or RNA helicase|uniref:Helicase n=1 Tax=Candidatus Wallbacteria bacterium HGW-Wallbacteria-1 TaxID=2013854 RepID=A0A2N1PLR4_9BACT|nr:MAG: helicase [Candidatus Wallbacteria bacterium HGW-Wallbacteria-1]